jgi:5-methylcytosine-specific restriction enzyme subunit McrC
MGLNREYIPINETTGVVKGKINIDETIKSNLLDKHKLNCSFDEFSLNTEFNRIIKTTLLYLLRSNIPLDKKKKIKLLIVYFGGVEYVDPHSINWDLKFNKTNQTYRMLLSICNLIMKGMLQTKSNGDYRLMDFIDEQRMSRLYEKFILEYYRKEYPSLNANPSLVSWALDDQNNYMLPEMKTDITLEKNGSVLIIDAKYYSHSLQTNFDKKTIISANIYQIFTYVKNKASKGKNVSGMLLYAKTDEQIVPDSVYSMSGNKISVKTLDLSSDFKSISKQLNIIANQFIRQ